MPMSAHSCSWLKDTITAVKSGVRVAHSHLHSQDSEDDEEGATDDHDVADGLQRRHEGLNHQLQARSSADDPETQHASHSE